MSLLNDRALLDNLHSKNPFLLNLRLPADLSSRTDGTSRLYSADSPIQGASVDLHVGNIFVPGVPAGDPGSATNPIKRGFLLNRGQTVLITTREIFDLPPRLAGIGFTPFRVALQGVFITSVGHVDPGYKGPLRLIVVNMSKQPYDIRADARIATVLLFSMEHPATKGYRDRPVENEDELGPRDGSVDQETLDRMASSFLSLDDRMRDLVNEKVLSSWTLPMIAVFVTAIVALVGPIASSTLADYFGLTSFHSSTELTLTRLNDELRGLDKRIALIETSQQQLSKPIQAHSKP